RLHHDYPDPVRSFSVFGHKKPVSLQKCTASIRLTSINLTSYLMSRSKGHSVMRIASLIARYLAGMIFLVMGLNGFVNFIHFPPPTGTAAQFMGALYVSHYLWVIFAFQLVAGVL